MKINHIIKEFVTPQATAQDPGLEREKDVDVIIFGRMPQDFTYNLLIEALEAVLPREYPPGSSQNTQGVPESPAERIGGKIAKNGGAVVTTKPLSIAQKLVKEFQSRGIKCKIDAPGLDEDITRRGFLQGAGAAAVAGAAGGAMAGVRNDAIESIAKLAGTIWDMRRLGYSRSSAVTTLETNYRLTGESLRVGILICDFAWAIPKDHFTRNEFVQQVRVQLSKNLPADSTSNPTPKKPEVKSTQKIQQSQPVQKNNIPQEKIRNWEPEQKQPNSGSGSQSISRESIEYSMAEGTAGLPDPNNFDSDNDYRKCNWWNARSNAF